MVNSVQQSKAAKEFALFWQDKGYEKGESQTFWLTLLNQVFGIEHPEQFIRFEQQVLLDHTSFIDASIPSTHVMIEQKSVEKDLGLPIKQSDGSMLNPFQQAKRYASELPYSQRPRWIVTCNFREFWVYDMEQPNAEPQKILLANLEKEYYRLLFLVDEGNEHLQRELEISVKAGDLVGKMYDLLLEQYTARAQATSMQEKDSDILRSLNILCVRIVFCLYAEDAGLFSSRTAFHDYLKPFTSKNMRGALERLFTILNTPIEERDPYLEDDLSVFPYVNGGLFGKEKILIPPFTEMLRNLLLDHMSAEFDWSEISPTIFGAVFESTLNPETRRSGGMHYTSIENIHKVIDPLFMNDLWTEFEACRSANGSLASKRQSLVAFQDKLASLTFFDPACGSGNFLTETYLSLRRLENEVIRAIYGNAPQIGLEGIIKVHISQFYGIEINDFACTVAKTALWIAENQMMQQTSAIAGRAINFLPLKTNAYIHEGNALRMDWKELFVEGQATSMQNLGAQATSMQEKDAGEPLALQLYPNYIIGNPPFVGFTFMGVEQKEDMDRIFPKVKNLDFVCGWYKMASDYIQDTNIRCAFVSTNSITQGETVGRFWPFLNIKIDFAYRTFRWDSETDIKAHVHCVIIGFSSSTASDNRPKKIYLSNAQTIDASNINPYLLDADDVIVESRNKPLCDVPQMINGNKVADGGNLIIEAKDYEEFIAKESNAAKWIHPLLGAEEFINNKKRYCLWLVGISPAELRSMPHVLERVRLCKETREASIAAAIRKFAETPHLFAQRTQPVGVPYILVPRVSSERRRYVPIGFVDGDVIASDAVQIIPNASLYHFGVLTSNVHMAWMRVVCGRLEMRYRYSKDIVYNNFPWPKEAKIESSQINSEVKNFTSLISRTAQAILDARALYPDSSLADLYDEVTMPPELRRAHQDNDRAVMQAYGFNPKMTESECVAELFKMYQVLT